MLAIQERVPDRLTSHSPQNSSAIYKMVGKPQVGSAYVQLSEFAMGVHSNGQCNNLESRFVQVTKKLILACSLAFAFMIFECVGGYFAQRCALAGCLEWCPEKQLHLGRRSICLLLSTPDWAPTRLCMQKTTTAALYSHALCEDQGSGV